MKRLAIAATLTAALALGSAVPASAAGEYDPYLVRTGTSTAPISGGADGALPTIPEGVTIVKTVQFEHTWVLTSDGNVLSSGEVVPAPPAGIRYVDIAASGGGVVLLRSDGQLVSSGNSTIPLLPAAPAGSRYAKIFGGYSLVAILDDGRAVMFRYFDDGDDDLPPAYVATATTGTDYVSATSGVDFVLLTKTNGRVKGVNVKDPNPDDCEDGNDSCDPDVDPAAMKVPSLSGSQTWRSVAAGPDFAVFVRSDGAVKTTGNDSMLHTLRADIPSGVRYLAASAGIGHAAFLLSDGDVYVTGEGRDGTLDHPSIPKNQRFIGVAAGGFATTFTAQKLTPNIKVQTSITRVSLPSPVSVGKTATVSVKVYSMAATRGGTVKITYKNKIIGTATVGDGAIAKVKISTKTMKRGANTIGVAFMGIGNAKKSLSNTRWVGTFRTK